jgi:hypothetical protein
MGVVSVALFILSIAANTYVMVHKWGTEEMEFFLGLASVVFIGVGSLVLARTGGNRVGWVLSITGLAMVISGVAGVQADQGELIGDALGGALWLSFLFLVGLLMYWYPTGAPVSPRWRWLGWVGFVGEGINLTYVVSENLCAQETPGAVWPGWTTRSASPVCPTPSTGHCRG